MDMNMLSKMFGGGNSITPDMISQFTGVSKEMIEQVTGVQKMLNKLPKDEQVRIMTSFVDDLKSSVGKIEGTVVDDTK